MRLRPTFRCDFESTGGMCASDYSGRARFLVNARYDVSDELKGATRCFPREVNVLSRDAVEVIAVISVISRRPPNGDEFDVVSARVIDNLLRVCGRNGLELDDGSGVVVTESTVVAI